MPKPSSEFSASLEVHAGARRLLVGSGLSLVLAGLAVIVTMPLDSVYRVGLAGAWLVLAWREFLGLARSFRRVQRLCLHPLSGLTLVDANGRRTAARILPGTAVLGRFVWLRFRDAGGRNCAELLPGSRRHQPEFRRASVILLLAGERDNR